MANAQSQDLNLQHGDEALHSLLQEWMTQLSKRVKAMDQTDRKVFSDLSDDASWTRRSYFPPSVLSPEPSINSPSDGSPEPSIEPNQLANIKELGSRGSVGRRAFRTIIRGLIVAIAVGAGWQVCRDDQTKEMLRTWVRSSLIWSSAILGTPRGSELAAEPGGKLPDQAVAPSAPTSIAIKEFPELQQQLQTMANDLTTLQRLVEQVASKQEQIFRDMTTLQTAEQNLSEKISSLAQPAAGRVAPRRNVAKLVHPEVPRQSGAEPLPLQLSTPETPSAADQLPRPPLPLSTPPTEAPSAAH